VPVRHHPATGAQDPTPEPRSAGLRDLLPTWWNLLYPSARSAGHWPAAGSRDTLRRSVLPRWAAPPRCRRASGGGPRRWRRLGFAVSIGGLAVGRLPACRLLTRCRCRADLAPRQAG
jgi:hypothetical protein